MKFKVYRVYYNNEPDKCFLFKKRANKYMNYLKYYAGATFIYTYYRKEYIYV